jgi:hypothetical protein
MNNDKAWMQALKQVQIPPYNDVAKQGSLDAAMQAFRQPAESPNVRECFVGRRQWSFTPAVGFIGIAVLALLLGWPFRGALIPEPGALQSERILLNEFAQLFPGQLRAVIARDGDIRPVLSASRTTWQQQPLLIRLRRGQEVIRVISFSGQRVELTLDDETLSIEALVTASDQVLLIVDDRATLDNERNRYAGYDIESQLLGVAL